MTRRQHRLAQEAGAALVADDLGPYLAALASRGRLALLCRLAAVLIAGAASATAIVVATAGDELGQSAPSPAGQIQRGSLRSIVHGSRPDEARPGSFTTRGEP